MVARSYARWKSTGDPPRKMRVQTRITWDDEPDRALPWYTVGDAADGTIRLAALEKIGRGDAS